MEPATEQELLALRSCPDERIKVWKVDSRLVGVKTPAPGIDPPAGITSALKLPAEKAEDGFQVGFRRRFPAQAGVDDPAARFDGPPIPKLMGGLERAPGRIDQRFLHAGDVCIEHRGKPHSRRQ
jgi:hypothetical protein